MFRTSSLADLLDLLDAPAAGEAPLLILPNGRAARELRSAFDARQQSLGKCAWEPAPVFSWAQWTTGLWNETVVSGAEMRLLLNATQEHSVWSEIIAADASASALASPDALASLAQSAWQLAASYRATGRLHSEATTYDNRIFAGWADAFVARCAGASYLSLALLEDALREHVRSRALAAPRLLHLAGFGDLTPARESLLGALRARGCEVVQHGLASGSALRASAVAPTERDELVLAAHWIRGFLKDSAAQHRAGVPLDGAAQDRPVLPRGGAARVAVLLPNLEQDRGELEAVFRETLAPELQSVTADLSSTPWEIAGGPSLASLPIVSAALDLARWAESPLPIERVSSLLLSPYVGDAPSAAPGTTQADAPAEREAVVQFDSRILRQDRPLRPERSLSSVLDLLESRKARALASGHRPPLLWPRRLHAFLQRSGDLSRPRSYADWTEFLRELLRTVNWPGPFHGAGALDATEARALTATEFAATQIWDSTLDLIATLDFSGRRVPFSVALKALERETEAAVFTPPFSRAPIQVMSLADSEGSFFDAAVFLRGTDANWPPGEQAHSLLPWALQRSLRMPGTDHAHTTRRARDFTAGLVARSGSVLFTCAAEDKDGPLRPSPLIAELRLKTRKLSELVAIPQPDAAVSMEIVPDDTALAAPPSAEVPGGARVLKLQAACGFLAFAELRLRAAQPGQAGVGFDPLESGALIHRALQAFWSEVNAQAQLGKVLTQDALRALDAKEREELLSRCIDQAFSPHARSSGPWDAAYLQLQKERCLSLLEHWLQEELKRGPFHVLSLEKEEQIPVGPLTLSVRMDRVDQVDGGVVFVDYKTGSKVELKQWEGPRPDEPQLPLYALFPEPGQLKGLAFAWIRPGRDMRWLGYEAEPGILPAARDLSGELAEMIEGWRATLTKLAEDFYSGRADVRPKSYAQNCARCGQRLLCRLDPATLLETSDEDAAAEEADEEVLDG